MFVRKVSPTLWLGRGALPVLLAGLVVAPVMVRAQPVDPPRTTQPPADVDGPGVPPENAQPTEPARPPAVRPPAAIVKAKPAVVVPKKKGFVIEFRFQTNVGLANYIAPLGLPMMSGRALFGYRLGRLTLGLGFEFSSIETKANGNHTAYYNLMFQPTVQYELFVAYPVSLFLAAGLHVGFMATAGRGVADDQNPNVGFHAGLGVRYFFHSRFALGLETGFQGLWNINDDDDITTGLAFFYAALSLMSIW